MGTNVEIITDRLVLRHPVMDDAAAINNAMNEVWPDLQKWMIWAHDGQQTMEATKEFIKNIGHTSLIGICRDTGKFVIAGGLLSADKNGEYKTGYWVAKEFLGQGLATEATCATLHYAFKELKAKAVHIGYLEGNDKSRRIIEKLGFTENGMTPKTHACCLDGTMMDEHEFIMTDISKLPEMSCRWNGQW